VERVKMMLPSGRHLRAQGAGLPSLQDVVVLGFAASRVTRAISLDEISAPLRERFAARAARGGPVFEWAHKLVTCPLCVGWWVSLALSFALPGRHRLVRGASVAGAQAMLALAERLVSEEGRAAIHDADIVEAQASTIAG
jgi:hypothetical protein